MNKENEIWKDIPEYEGFYQVSNLGRVKSLSRRTMFGRAYKITEEKILNFNLSKTGYNSVMLYRKGCSKRFKVHKLVAMAFLNHNINSKEIINHKNKIKNDNRLENLEICSIRYNVVYSIDKSKTSSKYTGVSFDKKSEKYNASISHNGVKKNLGRFINEYDAHIAYESYKKKYNLI